MAKKQGHVLSSQEGNYVLLYFANDPAIFITGLIVSPLGQQPEGGCLDTTAFTVELEHRRGKPQMEQIQKQSSSTQS